MGEHKEYAIITCDESIALTKYGAITIPTVGRCLDGGLPGNQLAGEVSEYLITLGMRESSDYLLVRFPASANSDYLVGQSITVSIFNLDGLYCLDEEACRFYTAKVGGGYYYACTDIAIDVESVIRESEQRRTIPLLSDAFGLTDHEVTAFKPFVESRFIKELAAFKRECSLGTEDRSFINDVATLAVVTAPHSGGSDNKLEKLKQKYRGGENIVERSPLLQKLAADAGLNSWGAIVTALETRFDEDDDSLQGLERYLAAINPPLSQILEDYTPSYTILSFIYLKAKSLSRVLAEYQSELILTELVDFYQQFTRAARWVVEVKLAIYCLITELGWSNLYSSYYRWKKLATYQQPEEYTSIADENKKLEEELQSTKNELNATGDSLRSEQRKVTDLSGQLNTAEDLLRSEQQKVTDLEDQLKAAESAEKREVGKLNSELKSTQELLQEKEAELSQLMAQQVPGGQKDLPSSLRKGDYLPVTILTSTLIESLNKPDLINICNHLDIALSDKAPVPNLKHTLKDFLLAQEQASSETLDEGRSARFKTERG